MVDQSTRSTVVGKPEFLFVTAWPQTKKDGVTSSADWKLDPAELSNLFNSKTKAIIYNNPNNPLGKVYKRDEIDMICDLCKKHDVLFISDDVYEHMVSSFCSGESEIRLGCYLVLCCR